MTQLIVGALVAIGLFSPVAWASPDTEKSHVVDKGYQFDDGSRKIVSTDSDGVVVERISSNSNITTPCRGANLPSQRTRDARVEKSLSCSGGLKIQEERTAEQFEKMPGFKEVAASGDQWALYEFMRKNSKTTWQYNLKYTTNVKWTWTKYLNGKNGTHCGYDYVPTACTRKTEIETRTCSYKSDVDTNSRGSGGGGYSPGGGGGGGGGRGGGGGGGSYERSNPFGFNNLDNVMEILIPKAHAGWECTSWRHSRYKYDNFTCFKRYVKTCDWQETVSDSFTCTQESMPVTVNLVKKSENEWNPSRPEYVPFLPNGNDLLPGEAENFELAYYISGDTVRHSEPVVSGGKIGASAPYYSYEHKFSGNNFTCEVEAKNNLQWDLIAKDRQVSQTPNSLLAKYLKNGRNTTDDRDFSKTGLFDIVGNDIVITAHGEDLEINAKPAVLKIIDPSSNALSSITAAFRRSDRRDGKVDNSKGTSVVRGQTTAGEVHSFWKDTFYRIQITEVFPGRRKNPVPVTDILVQTDSLISRRGNLITIPLAGQNSDTVSAYDLSSSGVVIPKGYFRVMGGQYQFIPQQAYEMKISMLHRGIPFYESGCANNAVSCEREKPNENAFSEVKTFNFVYKGPDERGLGRRYYDNMRRRW